MSEDFDDFGYPGPGPIKRDRLDTVIATVQQRLDLLAVVQHRYRADVEPSDARWKTACFLPSTIAGFTGTCAEQDASAKTSTPKNFWISEGDACRVWRCFSCGRRGDVIDLIEQADQLARSTSFQVGLSAIRRAAQLAGLLYLLDDRAPDGRDDAADFVDEDAPRRVLAPPPPTVDFDRARAINARAAKYWREQLRSGFGYLARAELKLRGVTDEQVKRFALGYAPDKWRELVGKLPKQAHAEAATLGLIGRTSTGDMYDKHRDRIVFPYLEPARDGRKQAVTGFAGRTMKWGTLIPREPTDKDKQAPKWFNSRNTTGVWKKSSALLGLLQAQQVMRKTDSARVVVGEGGWEVLAFDRLDAACVGLVAAELTVDHVHALATVLGAKRITLAGDGDTPGRRGLVAGVIAALSYGYRVSELDVIDSPDGLDPGKQGETRDGLERLRLAWESPQPLVDFLRAREDIMRPQQKRALVAVLPPDLAQDFATRWGVPYEREQDTPAHAEALTPAGVFVAAFDAAPTLARHFDGEQVRAVFAQDALVSEQLAGLTFGDATDLDATPIALRRAWLTCLGEHLQATLDRHDESDRFKYLPDGGHASFVAWYKHGETLQARIKKTTRMLAKIGA